MVLYHTKPVSQPLRRAQACFCRAPLVTVRGVTPPLRSSGELRLCNCDLQQCEAMCCYDGAYLDPQEERFLHELVAKVPQLRDRLPDTYVVEGSWNGELLGRKTATRPHEYRNPLYPAHFTRTRCVFADESGFCTLETFARSRGQHPWTFKPSVCWLFPMQESEGEPAAPVADPRADPHQLPDYPGYATVVGCGRHDPAGRPWTEALARERAWLAQVKSLPILGSAGHSVDELLASGPGADEAAP
jgi:Protein of unknown function (DUF3109)